MKNSFLALGLLVGTVIAASASAAGTLVIAHRGASGYLPEHTLAAVAMAYAQGADYIEQDVVLTKDDVPIVLHDLTLDATTNVAQVFPGRARDDGKYYAIDFTLEEIRQLRVGERMKGGQPAFEGRFPGDVQVLRVPTLAEEIELIQGLNQSTGRDVGIYVELKHPAFHAAAGRSFPASVLQILYAYGYRGADDRVFLQCFDAGTLRFLKGHTEIRLVQLLEDKTLTAERARDIASYAQGVGPWISYLTDQPEFVVAAQEAGLEVHPYTFRADALPRGIESYRALLDRFIRNMQVDGVFTDHPDLTRRYVDSLGRGR